MSHQQETDCMPSGPVDQHKLFEQFVGTWKAEVKMWMGPGEPMVSTGTMVNSLDLGGRYLKQDYKGDADDGPFPNFEGRGFFGYNDASAQFEGLWIDNASNQMGTEKGDYDPKTRTWNMHGSMSMGPGKVCKKRSVITIKDDNSHSMEMYFDMPGMGESKGMHIDYVRA